MVYISGFVVYSPLTKKVFQVIKFIKFIRKEIKIMKFIKFEDIIAWNKSKELTLLIYREFKNCRDFNFKDQIQRAVISIMNNIAEGFERMSNREFKNFLSIAKGSSGEVRSMLYVAKSLNYIDDRIFQDLNNKSFEIARIISGLIKTL